MMEYRKLLEKLVNNRINVQQNFVCRFLANYLTVRFLKMYSVTK